MPVIITKYRRRYEKAMGLPIRVKKVTPIDYLAFERGAEGRHEYFDGEIFAMSGGTARHRLIQTNLLAVLWHALKGRPCTVYNNDLRILIDKAGLYTYPDASIICGALEFPAGEDDIVLNPTVIFEVLSDSTEAYDRGRKFGHYRQIPSLEEYVVISQKEPLIETNRRNLDQTWTMTESRGTSATMILASVGLTLSLAEIYDRVDFSQTDSSTS